MVQSASLIGLLCTMRPGSKLLLQSALDHYKDGNTAENTLRKSYKCDVSLLPPELSRCFVWLQPDDIETRDFLERSKKIASNVCLQLFYSFVQFLLCMFMSQTTINGLLEKGKMFVFSLEQLKTLLPTSLPNPQPSILDIGSGDGHVTDKIKKLFDAATIHVTETSRVMQRVLRQRGYRVVDENSWHEEGPRYDLISCLNVLDRCDKPLSMLSAITDNLLPGGVLIIALVLPYGPFVENHSLQAKPSEVLPIDNASWEEGVASLWKHVLSPLGYTPLALSRVPYLCEGDMGTNYYALDDAVFVLRRT